ncbi:MAG: hypothetical protein ACWGMZ_05990 [Thermoguttaceae bacterium]
MLNIKRNTVFLLSVLLLSQVRILAQEVPSGETLMPENTRGFISITNLDVLIEHYNKTQLGKLTSDPVMDPFTKDVRNQFEKRWSAVHVRLGLTLDDLKEVPGGEVCVGLIEPPNSSAMAIIVDITNHHQQADALLAKVTKNITDQGGKRSTLKVEESADDVIRFEMAIPEEEQEAVRSKLPDSKSLGAHSTPAVPTREAPKPRVAYYVVTGNVLCITDSLEVTRGILGRLAHKEDKSLAEVKGYVKVMERCRADLGDLTPQIHWFINPVGYAAAARAATEPEKRRKGKSILEIMRNQGVEAIQGIGGFASFSTEGFDLIHRTAVYAPPPYINAMKMLVLLNGDDYTPQKWVPRQIATYSTLYFDIQNAFDNFGPLFDELIGDGEAGAWQEALQGLKKDPNGPQIDLGQDLIKYLGPRISMITDYELPITTSSERLLFAIETSDEKATETAIEKWMGPATKRREIDGHVIWELVEDEEPEMASLDISLGDMPDLAPPPKPKRSNQETFLPHRSVTVCKGNLFIASHLDFLLKVLKSDDPLTQDADYQLVNSTIKKLKPEKTCLRVFSRTDEEYRPTYELIRQNKMPESESILGHLLNMLFGEGKKGVVRQQKIDGSRLPDYEIVRHYLGPAGMQVTAEKDGWFLKGFTLNKEILKGEATTQATEAPKAAAEPKAAESPKKEEKKEELPKAPAPPEIKTKVETETSSKQTGDSKTEKTTESKTDAESTQSEKPEKQTDVQSEKSEPEPASEPSAEKEN